MMSQKFILKLLLPLFFLSLNACSSITSHDSLAAESNIQLGLAYLENGQISLAKKKLLLALEQDRKSSLAYDAMGYFLEQSGTPEIAERYYLRAISLATVKYRGISYNNYGTYLYRQKRFRDAIHYFLLAAKEPNYLEVANVYENAGKAASALNEYKIAKIYFAKSLNNDPMRNVAK